MLPALLAALAPMPCAAPAAAFFETEDFFLLWRSGIIAMCTKNRPPKKISSCTGQLDEIVVAIRESRIVDEFVEVPWVSSAGGSSLTK
jgi:hypothetical protein